MTYTHEEVEMIKRQAKAEPHQCLVNPHNCIVCPMVFKRSCNETCNVAAKRLLASLPKTKREFKVGDTVLIKAKIVMISEGDLYPVVVKIGAHSSMCFTSNGKYLSDSPYRTLFHRKAKS